MRELGTCVFLGSVARPPQLLKGFARAVRNSLLYLACIYTHCVACSQLQSVLGYSRSDTLVGRIHRVFTCKTLLSYYQAMLVFFNNIRSTFMSVYRYDVM